MDWLAQRDAGDPAAEDPELQILRLFALEAANPRPAELVRTLLHTMSHTLLRAPRRRPGRILRIVPGRVGRTRNPHVRPLRQQLQERDHGLTLDTDQQPNHAMAGTIRRRRTKMRQRPPLPLSDRTSLRALPLHHLRMPRLQPRPRPKNAPHLLAACGCSWCVDLRPRPRHQRLSLPPGNCRPERAVTSDKQAQPQSASVNSESATPISTPTCVAKTVTFDRW